MVYIGFYRALFYKSQIRLDTGIFFPNKHNLTSSSFFHKKDYNRLKIHILLNSKSIMHSPWKFMEQETVYILG